MDSPIPRLSRGGSSRAAERRAAFAREYVKDWNGTQAAIRAGYAPSGAKVRACHLLRRTDVRAAIEKARSTIHAVAQREFEIDVATVLRELWRIGMSDARKLFDENGNLKPAAQWDDDTAAAVVSIKTTTIGDTVVVTDVKMAPKVPALDSIGRHLGMFKEDNKQKAMGALAEALAMIDGRTANLIDVTPGSPHGGVIVRNDE